MQCDLHSKFDAWERDTGQGHPAFCASGDKILLFRSFTKQNI